MPVELRIPEVGESITEVEIQQWLKKVGDMVQAGEPLAELETDKATLQLPSPAKGRLSKMVKVVGDKAGIGEIIGYLEQDESAAIPTASPAADASPAPTVKVQQPQAAAPAPAPAAPKAAPAPAPAAPKAAPAPAPAPAAVVETPVLPAAPAIPSTPAQPGERRETIVPMSPMRRRIAQRLVEAQRNAALLTTFNEVDMLAVQTLRNEYKDSFKEKHGVKLGFMSFFVKAAVAALKEHPVINAEIREDKIVYREYHDIGIALNTPKGLVVPILRDADRMSFADIERAIIDFAVRAEKNDIKLKELEGGTFTVSNGGVFGSMLSTPIVNPPQSGILGMHAITDRPVVVKGQIVIRPMMYLALSYDHRIVDGKGAVTFLKRIKQIIEDPTRLLIDV